MIVRLFVVFVFVSVPVFGQSRIITNADLGKPVTQKMPPVSAETLRGLAERQFVWYPTYYGPTIIIASQPKNMSGPWDWPKPMPARRLDGSLMSDPPWSVTAYLPHDTYGSRRRFPQGRELSPVPAGPLPRR